MVRQMQMVIMMMERDRVGWGWYFGQHDGGVDGTYTIGRDMVRMAMVNLLMEEMQAGTWSSRA